MNKKIFYIFAVAAILFLVGCRVPDTQPEDVSFVPIDQIKIAESNETGDDLPPLPDDMAAEDNLGDEQDMQETSSDIIDEGTNMENESTESIEGTTSNELNEGSSQTAQTEGSTEEGSMGKSNKEIVIIVQETDLVSLKPVASDPDQDTLKFTYSSPLDNEGQWQTTYGDAGEYTVTITASDAELTTSKDALLIVNKKEEAPTLDSISPEKVEQTIAENTEIDFSVEASDLNDDPLSYEWKLDGEVVSTGKDFTYEADFNSAGSHTLKLDVSDGQNIVTMLWSLTVNNVDRAPVLKVIPDLTVRETETVIIVPSATDPDGDEIGYTISDPVGDDGIWETTYDSAGVYNVNVVASDGELSDSQQVKVTVINVNRPPVIEDIIQG